MHFDCLFSLSFFCWANGLFRILHYVVFTLSALILMNHANSILKRPSHQQQPHVAALPQEQPAPPPTSPVSHQPNHFIHPFLLSQLHHHQLPQIHTSHSHNCSSNPLVTNGILGFSTASSNSTSNCSSLSLNSSSISAAAAPPSTILQQHLQLPVAADTTNKLSTHLSDTSLSTCFSTATVPPPMLAKSYSNPPSLRSKKNLGRIVQCVPPSTRMTNGVLIGLTGLDVS